MSSTSAPSPQASLFTDLTAPKLTTIEATVVRIRFENAENGFRIVVVDANGQAQTWVGVMPTLREGMNIKGMGTWGSHAKFGPQFETSLVLPVEPTTTEGIAEWIGTCGAKGVGPRLAEQIVAKFGDKTLKMLDSPEGIAEMAKKVARLTIEKAQAIAEKWAEERGVAEVLIWLQGHGIPAHLAHKIYKRYKSRSIEVVSKSPYRLAIDIVGVGFKTADGIAQKLGTATDSLDRSMAGVLHCLGEVSESGHCYTPSETLLTDAVKLLGSPATVVWEGVEALKTEGLICVEERNGDDDVYLAAIHAAEHRVAARLVDLRHAETAPGIVLGDEEPAPELARVAEAAMASFEADAGFRLAETQREAIRAVANNKILVITGGPGVGKAQPFSSKILTPTGWRTMGEIEVGDLVIGASGSPTKVLGVYDQGELDVYRVVMDDGGSALCCEDHLWLTKTRAERRDRRAVKNPPKTAKVRSLREIMRTLKRAGDDGANHSIPYAKPAQLEPMGELPIDPWALGVYLGDGNCNAATVRISNPENDLRSRFSNALPAGDAPGNTPSDPLVLSVTRPGTRDRSVTAKALFGLGLDGLCSHEKFIPLPYLRASIEDRVALLQGLCDTDGYVVDSSGKSIELSTASPRLCEDISFLVGSLGGRVTYTERPTHYTINGVRHEARTAYRMILSFPGDHITPVSSEKHLRAWRGGVNRINERFIHSIDRVGRMPCRCIRVATEDSLYITDDFIVTHNTSIVRALIKLFDLGKLSVALAAPTGRAAKRMTEATKRPAQTIHRLLQWDPQNSVFLANRSNPIDKDAIIIDESSMVDLLLADHLLDAIPNDARLILVGDVDQLPSVGPGALLKDVIDSGVIPVVRLSTIFRQAEGSLIIENAHRINQGIPPQTGPHRSDFHLVTREEAKEAADTIVDMVAKRVPNGYGFDPRTEIQVLSPMHKGDAGVGALNERLQAALNPVGPSISRGKTVYRLGDRVMQTKNDYEREVFNGDLGFVVEVKESGKKEGPLLVVDIDGRRVPYENKHLQELVLAYAMSIHKCVAPETLVETTQGLLPIAAIREEGVIATPTGPKKYNHLVENPTGPALRLRTKDGYELTATPEHGLDVWREGAYVRVPASEIRVGDVVRLKLGASIEPTGEVLLPPPPSVDVRAKIYKFPTRMTPELAEFLGLMVADGVLRHNTIRLVKRHQAVAERFAYLARHLFGATPVPFTVKNAFAYEVCSTQIAGWCKAIGGLDAHQKAIPDCILRSPSSVHGHFLRGLFEDGSVHLSKTADMVDHIEFSTAYEPICRAVKTMLLRLGIVSGTTTGRLSKVVIYSGFAKLFAETIGMIAEAKQERLAKEYTPLDRYWVPVTSSEVTGLRKAHPELFTKYDYVNTRTAGHLSRAKVQRLLDNAASPIVGALRERMGFHHDTVKSITAMTSPSMCVAVPEGHQFLQNGFAGWNSQGGQYPCIIVPVLRSHFMMLSRNLVYTAVTRGEKLVIMVADPSAIRIALAEVRREVRRTRLGNRLRYEDRGHALCADPADPFPKNGSDAEISAWHQREADRGLSSLKKLVAEMPAEKQQALRDALGDEVDDEPVESDDLVL